MTFILWEGTARLKNSRGNIYLPLISICSKNYSHTASRSYCNSTGAPWSVLTFLYQRVDTWESLASRNCF